MVTISRRSAILGATAAIGAMRFTTRAEAQRAIKLIVVVPAGASMDTLVRTVADKLPDVIGRAVTVDYRVGGTGLAAATFMKTTEPDGEHVMFAPISCVAFFPFLYSSLPYDPDRDLVAVCEGATSPNAIAVNKTIGVTTLPDYIAAVKKDPMLGSIGTSGLASVGSFLVHKMRQVTGAELRLVAYRGGQPLLTDLLGSHVPAGQSVVSDYLEPHRSGMVKVIGISPAQRSKLAPDLPTFAEQGFPDLHGHTTMGFFMRAGTPGDTVQHYAASLSKVLAIPDVVKRLAVLGMEATGGTPDAFAQTIRAERARWEPVAREAGIKLS